MSDDEEMFEIEINMKRYRELRESKCKEVENQGPIRLAIDMHVYKFDEAL